MKKSGRFEFLFFATLLLAFCITSCNSDLNEEGGNPSPDITSEVSSKMGNQKFSTIPKGTKVKIYLNSIATKGSVGVKYTSLILKPRITKKGYFHIIDARTGKMIYKIADTKGKTVAFRGSNGRFLSSENGDIPVSPDRRKIADWERFKIVYFSKQKNFGIQANNGRWLSSENGDPMTSNRKHPQAWEKFNFRNYGNGKFGIMYSKGNNNNHWVTISNEAKLQAYHSKKKEIFEVEMLDGFNWKTMSRKVAIKHKSTNRYLSSENGKKPVAVNRTQKMEWEIFNLEVLKNKRINGHDIIKLKGNNGRYISSEKSKKAMTCNRTKAQEWELFYAHIINNSGNNHNHDNHDHGNHNHGNTPGNMGNMGDNTTNTSKPVGNNGIKYTKNETRQITVTNFRVNKDKIDLGPSSIHNQIPVQTANGLKFQNLHNNNFLLLRGVSLRNLRPSNFLPILDAHLQQDLSAILAWENGKALVRPNTVYIRSHEQNKREIVNFNPSKDKINLMYLSVRGDNQTNFKVEQTAAGVRFFSPVTKQSMTLRNIRFKDLKSEHFEYRSNQLEDNVTDRMGLSSKIAGFRIVNSNIYNGTSMANAGGVNQAPYHRFSNKKYTGKPRGQK